MKKLFLTVMIGIFPNAASAGFWDGNDLHQFCTEQPLSYKEAAAIGYVTAVIDTILALKEMNTLPQDIMCIPTGVTIDQVKDIICRGLAENPEKRHATASLLSTTYLLQAFPCKN